MTMSRYEFHIMSLKKIEWCISNSQRDRNICQFEISTQSRFQRDRMKVVSTCWYVEYSHMYSWNIPSHLTMERLQLLLDYKVLEHGKCCGSPVLVSSHDISLWARTTMTCGNGCWTIKPCINELVIAWFYFILTLPLMTIYEPINDLMKN